MRDRSLEFKVGLLIASALALLGGLLFVLGSFSLAKGYRLYVDYQFSGNIQPGAPVKVSGIKVGKVEKVLYLGGEKDPKSGRRVQVRVVLWLEERVRNAVRKNAEFFVNTQGVLGEQYIEIAPGNYDQPPLPPETVIVGVDPPRTDLIVARLFEFLDHVTLLLRDNKDAIRDFLSSSTAAIRTVDRVLVDNRGEISRLIANLDRLSAEAASLLERLRAGIGDGRELRQTLAHVEKISGVVARDIDPLLERTRRTLDEASQALATLGPEQRQQVRRSLESLVQVAERMRALTGDAQALVADLRRGKGTAGALLVDDEVYDNMREMVRDLKRNPWKFLWKE